MVFILIDEQASQLAVADVMVIHNALVQAAYAAMQATPVAERQLESLQRLLSELCARGDIATLVQLPFSGASCWLLSCLQAFCVNLSYFRGK